MIWNFGAVMHDILDMMPEGVRANKARVILQRLIGSMEMLEDKYSMEGSRVTKPVESIILRYVKAKADWWTNIAHYNRERIKGTQQVTKLLSKKYW